MFLSAVEHRLSDGLDRLTIDWGSGEGTDDGSSAGLPILFDIRISKGELALVNLALARWLIEAILLSTDQENRKNQTVVEIFSSFYLMILEVSFLTSLLFLFFNLI